MDYLFHVVFCTIYVFGQAPYLQRAHRARLCFFAVAVQEYKMQIADAVICHSAKLTEVLDATSIIPKIRFHF